MNVEILGERVPSGGDGFIVGNVNGVIEIVFQRHVEGERERNSRAISFNNEVQTVKTLWAALSQSQRSFSRRPNAAVQRE